MRPLTKLLLLRGVIVVVVGALAIVAFASGEEVFGALLAGLAITNVILIAIFASRQLAQRGTDTEDGGVAQG